MELDRELRHGHSMWAIRWGFWIGPIAWLLDLGISYALTQHACSTGHFYVLHVLTWVFFVVALSGAAAAASTFRHPEFPHESIKEGVRPRDRAYFQAIVGIGMSLAFAVIIIAGTVPRLILSPCD